MTKFGQNRPTFDQNRPTFEQNRPTFEQIDESNQIDLN